MAAAAEMRQGISSHGMDVVLQLQHQEFQHIVD